MAPESKPRLDPRVAIGIRIDLQYPPRGEMWWRGETIDLSASGALVRCEHPLPLKTQVGCRLYLPPSGIDPDRLIDVEAVVIRINPPVTGAKEWRYGLYFLGFTGEDLQSLRRFLFSTM